MHIAAGESSLPPMSSILKRLPSEWPAHTERPSDSVFTSNSIGHFLFLSLCRANECPEFGTLIGGNNVSSTVALQTGHSGISDRRLTSSRLMAYGGRFRGALNFRERLATLMVSADSRRFAFMAAFIARFRRVQIVRAACTMCVRQHI